MARKIISFKITAEEAEKITAIVARAKGDYPALNVEGATMDLTAVHANGCPLDLNKLLAADKLNFSHDEYGIMNHLDRHTGKLKHCFCPRFAMPGDH